MCGGVPVHHIGDAGDYTCAPRASRVKSKLMLGHSQ